jgi:hypothetical protein
VSGHEFVSEGYVFVRQRIIICIGVEIFNLDTVITVILSGPVLEQNSLESKLKIELRGRHYVVLLRSSNNNNNFL